MGKRLSSIASKTVRLGTITALTMGGCAGYEFANNDKDPVATGEDLGYTAGAGTATVGGVAIGAVRGLARAGGDGEPIIEVNLPSSGDSVTLSEDGYSVRGGDTWIRLGAGVLDIADIIDCAEAGILPPLMPGQVLDVKELLSNCSAQG